MKFPFFGERFKKKEITESEIRLETPEKVSEAVQPESKSEQPAAEKKELSAERQQVLRSLVKDASDLLLSRKEIIKDLEFYSDVAIAAADSGDFDTALKVAGKIDSYDSNPYFSYSDKAYYGIVKEAVEEKKTNWLFSAEIEIKNPFYIALVYIERSKFYNDENFLKVALEISEKILSSDYRARALVKIAKAGDLEAANKAIEVAKEIKHEEDRAKIYVDLAELDNSRAFDLAIKLTKEIHGYPMDPEYSAAEAAESLFVRLVGIAAAQKNDKLAFELLGNISIPLYRSQAFVKIAKADNPEFLENAMEAADYVESESDRLKAYIAIWKAADPNIYKTPNEAMNKAIQLVNSMSNDFVGEKSDAYFILAKAGRTEFLLDAIKLAKRRKGSMEVDKIYSQIPSNIKNIIELNLKVAKILRDPNLEIKPEFLEKIKLELEELEKANRELKFPPSERGVESR